MLKLERFTTEMSESIKEETATREAALKQCTATLSSLKEQVGGLHKSLDAAGEQLRDKAEQHSISKLEVALTEAMDLIGLLARRSGGQAQGLRQPTAGRGRRALHFLRPISNRGVRTPL